MKKKRRGPRELFSKTIPYVAQVLQRRIASKCLLNTSWTNGLD
jgi:hypothetical protein